MNQVKVVILIAPKEKDARKLLAELKGMDRAGWVGLTYYPLSDGNPKSFRGISLDCVTTSDCNEDLEYSVPEHLDRGSDEPSRLN